MDDTQIRVPTVRLPDDSGRILLDLRVAVTGHGTLVNAQAVTEAVGGALDMILDTLPAEVRANCRLVAVCALADEADRLVANCVLKRPNGRLEVILPRPMNEYLNDFSSADSATEFERLIAEASWVATIAPEPARDGCYAAAEKAIVDRSDVTVAIGDGHDAGGKGSPGRMVDYARRKHRPLILISAAGGEPVTGNLTHLVEEGWPAGLTAKHMSNLRQFNTTLAPAGQCAVIASEFSEQICASVGDIGAEAIGDLLDWIGPPLARAELLSRRFRLLYLRVSAALFALAALAVCIVGMQLAFFPDIRLIVSGEIACLVAIIGGLEWGRRRHVQQRWISTRYLAERLRNAFFLALAGANERPSPTSIRAVEDPGAPWARVAFRMVWARRPQWDSSGVGVGPLRSFLADAWIDEQIRYFSEAWQHDWKKHRTSGLVAEGLFGISVAVAIAHVVLGGPENWLHHLVSLLSVSIPACAAALAGHNAQREFPRHARRYRRMARLLTGARGRMLAAKNHIHVRRVASMVDLMLREECGDWFGAVNLHDLELPA